MFFPRTPFIFVRFAAQMSAKEKESSNKEVTLLSKMKHPNIVTFIRSFQGMCGLQSRRCNVSVYISVKVFSGCLYRERQPLYSDGVLWRRRSDEENQHTERSSFHWGAGIPHPGLSYLIKADQIFLTVIVLHWRTFSLCYYCTQVITVQTHIDQT